MVFNERHVFAYLGLSEANSQEEFEMLIPPEVMEYIFEKSPEYKPQIKNEEFFLSPRQSDKNSILNEEEYL